ncbi:hypothetical protein CHELA40_50777 [Chelatococcus asaccharovorans]|nr:hypothetical protein CHELA17_20743 [Chelatococcus asaccharovorans]CAH1694247.1 hypothetical protein CHELA40_50777 [Chelatococcus asaccharovorans]
MRGQDPGHELKTVVEAGRNPVHGSDQGRAAAANEPKAQTTTQQFNDGDHGDASCPLDEKRARSRHAERHLRFAQDEASRATYKAPAGKNPHLDVRLAQGRCDAGRAAAVMQISRDHPNDVCHANACLLRIHL